LIFLSLRHGHVAVSRVSRIIIRHAILFFIKTSGKPLCLSILPLLHSAQKKAVGVERGPLSLVSTTEELLDRKVAAPV
jgi:hypothetical protein